MNPEDVLQNPERFPNFNQEALNGSIHLIDRPLVYDEDVMAGFVLNGIIRIDYDAMVPELTNNHIRWYDGTAGYQFKGGSGFYIPNGYSEHVKFYSEETRLSYYAPYDGFDRITVRSQIEGHNPDIVFLAVVSIPFKNHSTDIRLHIY